MPRRLADSAIALLFPGGTRLCGVMWSVDGYLFPHEGAFLYQIGRFASAGEPIVEIGSMRGLSTCCLASGVRASGRSAKVIAIDPHLYGTEAELRSNLKRLGFEPVVDVRVAHAQDISEGLNGQLSAVFIDGAHDLQSVSQDFDTWSPRVKHGGFVLIHDSTPLSKFPGPALIADTRLHAGDQFDMVGRIGSISWGRKCGGHGWLPRMHGASLVDSLIRIAKRGRNESQG
ncbi:MAG TPA: class I SAM-dependent methyltransferase [Candidatus Binatia bacterium]|nr:class I SAM-dependent methyltransferase [Candidatus Binatia bacterium]